MKVQQIAFSLALRGRDRTLSGSTQGTSMIFVRRHIWVLIVAILLTVCVCFIFNSGRVMTCSWGLVMAATLFWMRERHPIAYGFTEVMAGLFILGQNYSNERGGSRPGLFAH